MQRLYDVEIDELNEPHVTRHGISVAEIYEVLRNDPVVRRNRKSRAAGYLAFGVSDAGRRIVVAFTTTVERPGRSRHGRTRHD